MVVISIYGAFSETVLASYESWILSFKMRCAGAAVVASLMTTFCFYQAFRLP